MPVGSPIIIAVFVLFLVGKGELICKYVDSFFCGFMISCFWSVEENVIVQEIAWIVIGQWKKISRQPIFFSFFFLIFNF